MRGAAESTGAGAAARELAAQAQLQRARARLAQRGAQFRQAVEAHLDVRAAVQRRAWVLLATAFAVGFWMGRGANRGGMMQGTEAQPYGERQAVAGDGAGGALLSLDWGQKVAVFVRENPGTALLGALAVGFVVGKMASRR